MTTDVQLRTQTPHPSPLPPPPCLPPSRPPPPARTHTRARLHITFFLFFLFFFYANVGRERELRTKDADLMVTICSLILQSRDRLLWEVGRSSGLVSLYTASSLTQAWSCRGEEKEEIVGLGASQALRTRCFCSSCDYCRISLNAAHIQL